MLFRVSFLVVVTAVAAISVSQKKENPSIKHASEKDGSNLHQIEKEEEHTDNLSAEKVQETEAKLIDTEVEMDAKPILHSKKYYRKNEFQIQDKRLKNDGKDIDHLRKLLTEYEQRKLIVERNLIELHSLKEQQSYIAVMQKNLEKKMEEIDRLQVATSSLQAERTRLQKEIKEGMMAEKQLDMAKKMIVKMQKKTDANGKYVKDQLIRLQEQVSGFQSNEISYEDSAAGERKQAFEDVELEFIEMKRKNKELELEKRELAVKLAAAQTRLTSLSNLTEKKNIAKIEEELSTFRHTNEDLSKEVESLQKNKFDMVEELVYQRWLNACLRFEIHNHHSLSKSLNTKKPQEKSDQMLIDDSNSSHTSSTESEKNDSSTTTESSSSSQRSITNKKSSLIHNIKKWERSKDDSDIKFFFTETSATQNGLSRRFSTSMVPSRPPKPSIEHNYRGNNTPLSDQKLQNVTKSLETTYVRRARRRVSFSNSTTTVISTCQEKKEPMEGVLHTKETSMITSPIYGAESNRQKQQISVAQVSIAESGISIDDNEQSVKKDNEHTKMEHIMENAHIEKQHSGDSEKLIVLFIFLFCVGCLLLAAGGGGFH